MKSLFALFVPGLLLTAALGLSSCASQLQLMQPVLRPMVSEDVAALDADDVVMIMGRAGFTEREVLDMGPRLRNNLAQSGASQIEHRDKIIAMYTVQGNLVYVTTRDKGIFRYDVTTKQFI